MAEAAVLVTRPAGQAATLSRLIAETGYKPVEFAMIEIVPLDELPQAQKQLVLDLDHFQHIIVVSSNAARHGMDWIHHYWPQVPTGIEWYAIGAITAAHLEAQGLTVQQPDTEMNSEGLLVVPGLQSVRDQRILILKGQGGREHLRSVLTARGARVDELACYYRTSPQGRARELLDTLRQNHFAALLFSSGEGVDNMLSLLPEEEHTAALEIPVIVPGERVAELASERGFRTVFTAANATDEAIFDTFERCVGSEGHGR
jgi:uroporphyrinogen-III synthase